ncbi:zinc finger protein 425 [Ixodes scapularis]|uniref:zinc finger protein 425 n=1 Tax=Ixodes scapularis TaxID=6945 RepID=UPI001A9F13BF|nr:zinc finger protein 425 [Ixodes scapularis]
MTTPSGSDGGEDYCPAMFVEAIYESPDASYLDRGKLLENLLTISHSGHPVIQERTEYPCPLCRGTFRALDDLVLHECPKERPNRPLLTCCFCAFATDMAVILRDHLKLHTNPSLRCGHCNNCFISEAALVKHLQLHGTSLPMLTFGIGAFSSNIPANQTAFGINGTIGGPNVPTYVVNVPEDRHSKYMCRLCNATFPRLSGLAAHGLKHPEFPDVYIQENVLIPRRSTHEPLGALMCCQCCLVFTHPLALAAHHCMGGAPSGGASNGPAAVNGEAPTGDDQMACSPVRLYCCPYCPYTSYLLASLQRHKEVHFSHRCVDCAVRFLTPGALTQHRQKFHAGGSQVSPVVPKAPPTNSNHTHPATRGRPKTPTQTSAQAAAIKSVESGWKCKTCDSTLHSCEEALAHRCATFECPHCTFVTHKPNGLSIHLSYAHSFKCKNCSNTFATKELQSLHGTYLCVNRPFKHIGEEDIPLAVLRRHPLLQSTAKKRGRLPKAAPQGTQKVSRRVSEASQAEPKRTTRKRGRPRGRRKRTA